MVALLILLDAFLPVLASELGQLHIRVNISNTLINHIFLTLQDINKTSDISKTSDMSRSHLARHSLAALFIRLVSAIVVPVALLLLRDEQPVLPALHLALVVLRK